MVVYEPARNLWLLPEWNLCFDFFPGDQRVNSGECKKKVSNIQSVILGFPLDPKSPVKPFIFFICTFSFYSTLFAFQFDSLKHVHFYVMRTKIYS